MADSLAKLKAAEAEAAEALQDIRLDRAVLLDEIAKIEQSQVDARDAGNAPDRAQEERRAHLAHEAHVAAQVESRRTERLAESQAAVRRAEDAASRTAVAKRLAETQRQADDLAAGWPDYLLTQMAAVRTIVLDIGARWDQLADLDAAELAAAEGLRAIAQRLGEDPPNVVTRDRRDQLRRSHFTADNPHAALIVSAGDDDTRARAVGAAAFHTFGYAAASPTGADLFASSTQATVARAGELAAAAGESTPLERGQRDQHEAARRLRLAQQTGQPT
jgi:hypothetical protein